jgi:hypothetical protein
MKRKLFVMFACAALVGAFCLTAWAIEPPAAMEIKMPSGTPTKAAVKFNHAGPGHKALECKTCHHNWDGKSETGLKCSDKGCHDNTDPAAKAEKNSWYHAFHDFNAPNSCLGCHKKAKAEGKNPPMACNACHPQ